MTWRIAKSLDKLRSQINAKYPKRDKSSDGTIGDAAHASRSSDHNPWVKDGKTGVVTGMDITNDPKNGMASGDLAEALLASRDPRIKYVISNARICSGDAGPSPWVWRKYSGANAHRHHVHLSVKSDKKFYDSVKPWSFTVKPAKFVEPIATVEEPEDELEDAPIVSQPTLPPATPKDSPHVAATAVKQTLLQRFWAKIVGLGAMAGAAVQGLSEQFNDVREYVRPFTSWFRDVPGWLWLVGIGGVALLIYLSATKANESIDRAKQAAGLN